MGEQSTQMSNKTKNAFLFYDSKTKVSNDHLEKIIEILNEKDFDVHVYKERVTFIEFLKSEVSKIKSNNSCTIVLMITKKCPVKIFRTFDMNDLKNVFSSETNIKNHQKYFFSILQDKYPNHQIKAILDNHEMLEHKNNYEFEAVYERSMQDEDFDKFFNRFCNCFMSIDNKEFTGRLLNMKIDHEQKIKIEILNELQQ